MDTVSGGFKELPKIETEIAARFRAVRIEQRYSQALAAENLGLTRDQLANVEAARVPLKFWTGWKACVFFRVNPRWLATGTGEKSPWSEEFSLAELLRSEVSERTRFSDGMDLVMKSPRPAGELPALSASSALSLFENEESARQFYAAMGVMRPAFETAGTAPKTNNPHDHPAARRVVPDFEDPKVLMEHLYRRIEWVVNHAPAEKIPAFLFHLEAAVDRFLGQPFMPRVQLQPAGAREAKKLAIQLVRALREIDSDRTQAPSKRRKGKLR